MSEHIAIGVVIGFVVGYVGGHVGAYLMARRVLTSGTAGTKMQAWQQRPKEPLIKKGGFNPGPPPGAVKPPDPPPTRPHRCARDDDGGRS